jgi:hypothetical protein
MLAFFQTVLMLLRQLVESFAFSSTGVAPNGKGLGENHLTP